MGVYRIPCGTPQVPVVRQQEKGASTPYYPTPKPKPKPKPKPVPNQVVKQQKKGAQNITVAVRVRPLTKAERDKHAYSTTKVLD